ncbi:hypothetical protein J7T55_005174 [Diaporthe amygdali]|uniref:uncharacterized protein n=1 Tax=Phomopsis amygdali TaxID=1214568 RepID=UPI0022FF2536|nr:uncharacterized protein J7T55_005174 [Diaporthe amygdali]KAJ0116228.1 hypothetical protein J7T55_005174 [Diaporthe amygdali]
MLWLVEEGSYDVKTGTELMLRMDAILCTTNVTLSGLSKGQQPTFTHKSVLNLSPSITAATPRAHLGNLGWPTRSRLAGSSPDAETHARHGRRTQGYQPHWRLAPAPATLGKVRTHLRADDCGADASVGGLRSCQGVD